MMKKTIFLFAFFFSLLTFAQIKVVKNESLVEVGKDNSVGLYKKQNKYTFNYQDINTSNLNTFRNFSFLDVNKDFEGLYNLISEGFIDMPASDVTLELPNDILDLHYEINYGQITVQFIHYINKNKKMIGKTHFLTKKQVDKIFGKKANSAQSTAKLLQSGPSTTKKTVPKNKK
ncbi:hypothetical protein [Chryseobacterium sp.]|uniref:hypothetical protein n=1 Tax=Chryseobacterium sp. TaxID=1871047 RepID=UPI0011C9015F|nr:hypothetical protein [Chryseobacterium sp.]TXF74865.1 hypothetical protein FUA25_11280 [Chryseobacterium sp.]